MQGLHCTKEPSSNLHLCIAAMFASTITMIDVALASNTRFTVRDPKTDTVWYVLYTHDTYQTCMYHIYYYGYFSCTIHVWLYHTRIYSVWCYIHSYIKAIKQFYIPFHCFQIQCVISYWFYSYKYTYMYSIHFSFRWPEKVCIFIVTHWCVW